MKYTADVLRLELRDTTNTNEIDDLTFMISYLVGPGRMNDGADIKFRAARNRQNARRQYRRRPKSGIKPGDRLNTPLGIWTVTQVEGHRVICEPGEDGMLRSMVYEMAVKWRIADTPGPRPGARVAMSDLQAGLTRIEARLPIAPDPVAISARVWALLPTDQDLTEAMLLAIIRQALLA